MRVIKYGLSGCTDHTIRLYVQTMKGSNCAFAEDFKKAVKDEVKKRNLKWD